MFRKKSYILLSLILVSCVQDGSQIIYKEGKTSDTTTQNTSLTPSYMRGTYVKTEDNKIVRDIRADNNEEKNNLIEEEKIDVKNNIEEKTINKTDKYKIITVKRGDNLINLAKENNMEFSDIVELNNLRKPYRIYAGQKLKVYDNDESNIKYDFVTVDAGYTLLRIAIDNDMTLREIATLNNIKPPYNVYVGQKIKIPENKNTKQQKKKTDYYIVKRGDNLYSIAKENNTTVRKLIDDNDLKRPYNIFPNQKLYVGEKSIAKKETIKKQEIKKNVVVKETNSEEKTVNETKTLAQEDTKKQEDAKKQEETKKQEKQTAIFAWPVKGEVIKNFGKQKDGKFYDAINIKADQGTAISSVADGEVAYAGNELKGYGNIIIIKHDNGWLSIYGYCDKINVKVKDKVSKGQTIATVGKTGNVNEPQLYFTMRKGRVAMDPLKYLENNN